MFLKISQIPQKAAVLETLLDKVATLKNLQHRSFPVKFARFLRTPVFTEQLQWLLLTFNSYFQSTPGRKPVWLTTISTRFSWKNGIRTTAPPEKNCPPVMAGVSVKVRVIFRVGGQQKKQISTSVKEIIPEFFYPFI